jgi:radical SAM superfamily enzyme YgiQ (UPF0313 family)
MHISFIKPSMGDLRSSDAMTPLAFGYLSAMTPPDVERVLYDERLEEIPLDEPTDLVAMTVETYTARRAYQLADAFRARGVPVVMGGYHPTFVPDEAARHADALVLGDAEGVWPRVVEDARRRRLAPRYGQAAPPPLAGITPDRSIFQGKGYAPVRLVQYGRGCKWACDFCSIHAFYGRNLRQRPVREVVEEIEALDGKLVFLVDDNIFADEARAEELFEALVPLGIRWTCQTSIDVAWKPGMVDLMRRSGCISVLIGFETLDPANLKQMRKAWNAKAQGYEGAIERLKDAGLMIYGTFVHGYDRDTPDSFERNLEFAVRNKFFLANFNPLTPTPATPLYERLRREGRLIRDPWWLDPSYRYGHATFHPRGMTATELEEGCYRARTRFNTLSSIARRAFDRRTNLSSLYNLGVFLAVNLISRTEIHRKQDAPLGARPPSTQPGRTPVPAEGLP